MIHYEDPNDPYYQLTEISREPVSVSTERVDLNTLKIAPKNPTLLFQTESFNAAAVSPWLIAQALFKVWDIVVENKPVVNIESKSVSALPVGADYHWSRLTGWMPERVVRQKLTIKNLYRMKTIEMEYAIRLMYGGGYRGRGQYIASARVVPYNVKVLWAYNMDVKVEVASVTNVGREDDPNAAIVLEIVWKVRTLAKRDEWKEQYLLQGDGFFRNQQTGEVYFEAKEHIPAPPLPPTPTPTPDPFDNDPLLPVDPGMFKSTPTPTPAPAMKKKTVKASA